MKKITLFLSCFLLCFTLQAQRDWSKVEITSKKLSETIYVLYGSGGNIGIAVAEDGVYMIDDQYAPLSEKIQTAIATITDKPIKYLVNTHWHGDHSGGNENFGKKGVVIVAHDNVRKRMSTKQFRGMGRIVEPSPAIALPQITFTEDLTLHLDTVTAMHIMHVHNAHTDGDSFVYFPNSNVLHMGDTFFKGRYPFIDLSSGGSIDGLIKAVNHALFIVNEDTKIIPGHGTVATRQDLLDYRDVLLTIRQRIKVAMDAGKSLETIQEMNLTKEWDETHGQAFIKPHQIVEFVYKSLKEE